MYFSSSVAKFPSAIAASRVQRNAWLSSSVSPFGASSISPEGESESSSPPPFPKTPLLPSVFPRSLFSVALISLLPALICTSTCTAPIPFAWIFATALLATHLPSVMQQNVQVSSSSQTSKPTMLLMALHLIISSINTWFMQRPEMHWVACRCNNESPLLSMFTSGGTPPTSTSCSVIELLGG